MARTLQLGDGGDDARDKEHTVFKKLATELPESWSVAWGKQFFQKDAKGKKSRESDFVIIGEARIFVCELKNWTGSWITRGQYWDGTDKEPPRKSPVVQIDQLLKKAREFFKSELGADNNAKLEKEYQSFKDKEKLEPFLIKGLVFIANDDLKLYDRNNNLIVGVDVPPGTVELEHEVILKSQFVERLKFHDSQFLKHLEKSNKQPLLKDESISNLIWNSLRELPPREPFKEIGTYTDCQKISQVANCAIYRGIQSQTKKEFNLYLVSKIDDVGGINDFKSKMQRCLESLTRLSEAGVAPIPQNPFPHGDTIEVLAVAAVENRISLEELFEGEEPTFEDFLAVVTACFKALKVVHSKEVSHRSLNPSCIWIKKPNENDGKAWTGVQFTNFEFSKPFDFSLDDSKTVDFEKFVEDSRFIASEPVKSLESDVFGMAKTLLSWWTKSDANDYEHALKIVANYSESLSKILKDSLASNPKDRPTVDQVIQTCDGCNAENPDIIGSLAANGYSDIEQIATGSTAIVFRAKNSDGFHHAVKVFCKAPDISRRRDQAKREATALNKFHHERIVPFRKVSEPNADVPFVSMKWLENATSLNKYFSTQQKGVAEIKKFAVSASRALEYMHTRSWLHRDIKPQNLIVSTNDDGEAEISLIDFGQAANVSQIGPAGTASFLDDSINDLKNHVWEETNDLYALAVSFMYILQDNVLPFEIRSDGEIDKNKIKICRRSNEEQALYEIFRKCTDADTSKRFPNATALREALESPIQIAPVISDQELDFLVNKNVDRLRRDITKSVLGANKGVEAHLKGERSEFAEATYVETHLDTKLLPQVLEKEKLLLLFSGNPGDGKTTFLNQLKSQLIRKNANFKYDDQFGWACIWEKHEFIAINDASQADNTGMSASQYCLSKFGPLREYRGGKPSHTILVAANDGRLLDLFSEEISLYKFQDLVEAHFSGQSKNEFGNRVEIVDFKRRALTMVADSKGSIATKLIAKYTSEALWETCKTCRAKSSCPILFNAKSLGMTGVGAPSERLHKLLESAHLRHQRRMTMRDLRSLVANGITADIGCEDVHKEIKNNVSPFNDHRRFYFWSLITGQSQKQENFNAFLALDPARHIRPQAERRLFQELATGWNEFGPEEIDRKVERAAVSTAFKVDTAVARDLARRRFYFEGDWRLIDPATDPETASDGLKALYRGFSPYLFEEEFKNSTSNNLTLATKEKLLLGLSRVLGVPGFSDAGLAVGTSRPGVSGYYSSESSRYLKVFPANDFEVAPLLYDSLLEYVPDRLNLVFKKAPVGFNFNLDSFEIIMRSAVGLITSSPEVVPFLEEVRRFGQNLLLADSPGAVLAAANGSKITISKVGTVIHGEAG